MKKVQVVKELKWCNNEVDVGSLHDRSNLTTHMIPTVISIEALKEFDDQKNTSCAVLFNKKINLVVLLNPTDLRL